MTRVRYSPFPLHLPIRYRPRGSRRWLEGITETIGGRRVTVRADELPEAHTPIDLRFEVRLGANHSEVACRAEVVRAMPSRKGGSAFAAAITAFRFLRRSRT